MQRSWIKESTDWNAFRDWYLRYAVNVAIAASACNFKPIIHARHANSSHNPSATSHDYPPNFQTRGLIIHTVAQRIALFRTIRYYSR